MIRSSGTETLLVVEDDAAVRRLIRDGLDKEGYTVLEAGDPDQALRLCREHAGEIHLLLIDVVLPSMGGRELAEAILSLRPDVKVVYMSGYTDNAIVHHGVLDPGTAFIEKPARSVSSASGDHPRICHACRLEPPRARTNRRRKRSVRATWGTMGRARQAGPCCPLRPGEGSMRSRTRFESRGLRGTALP